MAGEVRIGRVLHEDDKFVTLEIAKSLETPLNIEDGDQLLTLAFLKGEEGQMVPWVPWEEE